VATADDLVQGLVDFHGISQAAELDSHQYIMRAKLTIHNINTYQRINMDKDPGLGML
jgi:hypothetical protein